MTSPEKKFVYGISTEMGDFSPSSVSVLLLGCQPSDIYLTFRSLTGKFIYVSPCSKRRKYQLIKKLARCGFFCFLFRILCINSVKLRAWLALQSNTSLAQCLHTHCWSQGTRRFRRVFCSIIRHLQNSQGPLPGEYRTKPGSACWSLSPHLISSEVLWLNSRQQQGRKEKKKREGTWQWLIQEKTAEVNPVFTFRVHQSICCPSH